MTLLTMEYLMKILTTLNICAISFNDITYNDTTYKDISYNDITNH
jgi:hypothetical protein